MSLNKRGKWYVVWTGRQTGVCDSWAECEARVKGFVGARYKSFPSQQEAIEAFRNSDPIGGDVLRAIAQAPTRVVNYEAIPDIERDSICVDAACSGVPGTMEYRGVNTLTGALLFHVGPFPDATNNIGEYLAIVHAIALMVKQGNDHTAVYSDSVTALSWVRQRRCKTTMKRTEANRHLFEVISRADRWITTHTWKNRILKWNTKEWGEIPADFGRK